MRLRARLRRARQALRTSTELIRDCGDWFPPLKAAAGGLANVLAQLELSAENTETCAELAARIGNIGLRLAHRACEDPDVPVDAQVAQLRRCMADITAELVKLTRQSHRCRPLSAYFWAKQDAARLQECKDRLDSEIQDTMLVATLSINDRLVNIEQSITTKQLARNTSSVPPNRQHLLLAVSVGVFLF